MHEPVGADHLPPECLADRLVPEADPERGELGAAAARTDSSTAIPASVGVQGPGEITIALGFERDGALHGDLVIPIHDGVRTELTQVLDQVRG